jgi:hypothetical protein
MAIAVVVSSQKSGFIISTIPNCLQAEIMRPSLSHTVE